MADSEDVPFLLLDDEPRNPAPEGQGDGVTGEVFLASRDDRLVAVDRRLGENNTAAALDSLLRAPSDSESEAGLRTALAEEDVQGVDEVSGGVVSVDLSAGFEQLGGSDQLLAIAQVVYSLTDRPGVGRVSFTLDGDSIDVPRGDGSLTSGSVSRDAYTELAPRR